MCQCCVRFVFTVSECCLCIRKRLWTDMVKDICTSVWVRKEKAETLMEVDMRHCMWAHFHSACFFSMWSPSHMKMTFQHHTHTLSYLTGVLLLEVTCLNVTTSLHTSLTRYRKYFGSVSGADWPSGEILEGQSLCGLREQHHRPVWYHHQPTCKWPLDCQSFVVPLCHSCYGVDRVCPGTCIDNENEINRSR